MKVAHAINDLGFGGAQRVVHELLRRWPSELTSPLLLVAREEPSELSNRIRDEGHAIHYLSRTWPRLRSLTSIVSELRRLRKERPLDVIFVHSYGLKQLLLLLHVTKLVQARIVTVEHTTFSLKLAESKRLRRAAVRWGSRLLYRSAAAHVCVSDGVAEDIGLQLAVDALKIRVIPNPVDTERIRNHSMMVPDPDFAAIFEGLPRPIVISVGRLSPEKNHQALLRAFAESRAASGSLVILGEGPERGRLEALGVELGLGIRLHMPSHQQNPWWFMRRCDVFVLSSVEEAFPLVLVEAMTLGCKIVSTRYPGNPEFASGGYSCIELVPINDERALARSIDNALGGKNEECSAELDHLDPSLVAQGYLAIARDLLQEPVK